MLEINKIYNCDCLDLMAKMPNNYCDIFTDPPYNLNKNYGNVNDNLADIDYIKFISTVFNEFKRIGKVIIIVTPHKWSLLYWKKLGIGFKDIILETNMQGAIRFGFANQFQRLLTNAKPGGKVRNVWRNINFTGCGYFFKENNFNHPGYTSLELTRKAIHYLSKDNIVYDAFMGTGTTAIACLKENKQYIGSELSSKYLNIAEKRIKNHKQQLKLF